MKKTRGYLCEHCHEKAAKYEAFMQYEGKNILVCWDCLHKLHHVKLDHRLFVDEKKHPLPWGGFADKEQTQIRNI
jgi:hypothetical protein